MAKRFGLTALLALLLTIGLWQVTGRLGLGRAADDVAFAVSPFIAIAFAAWIVWTKLLPRR